MYDESPLWEMLVKARRPSITRTLTRWLMCRPFSLAPSPALVWFARCDAVQRHVPSSSNSLALMPPPLLFRYRCRLVIYQSQRVAVTGGLCSCRRCYVGWPRRTMTPPRRRRYSSALANRQKTIVWKSWKKLVCHCPFVVDGILLFFFFFFLTTWTHDCWHVSEGGAAAAEHWQELHSPGHTSKVTPFLWINSKHVESF